MMEKLRAICDDPEHANLFKELEKFVGKSFVFTIIVLF